MRPCACKGVGVPKRTLGLKANLPPCPPPCPASVLLLSWLALPCSAVVAILCRAPTAGIGRAHLIGCALTDNVNVNVNGKRKRKRCSLITLYDFEGTAEAAEQGLGVPFGTLRNKEGENKGLKAGRYGALHVMELRK